MRRLPLPNISVQQAYSACADGVGSLEFKSRLEACSSEIIDKATEYFQCAKSAALHNIPPLNSISENKNPIVVGDLKKSELIKLYTDYMVPKKKPARDIYDQILVTADGTCPFCCGIGHVSTLDHYLAKTKYPQFSVLPANLIPSCSDCNTGKDDTFALIETEQVLHPYFDEDCFFTEKWIFAKIIRTPSIPVINFYVSAPKTWNLTKKLRIEKHFNNFKLGKKFSIQAALALTELRDLRTGFAKDYNSEQFSEYLFSYSTSSLPINHWKRVMYDALSKDEWFCAIDFNNIKQQIIF